MDSSAYEQSLEVLAQRGMAFAHEHGGGWLGVQDGIMAPSRGPRKGLFAGERHRGPRFAPLGGSDALVRLPCR